MQLFSQLFADLDQTNSTNDKIQLLTKYFDVVSDADKLWTIALFTGRRPKREINSAKLRQWAAEGSGLPDWLLEESYSQVGDFSETVSLIVPQKRILSDVPLSEWMNGFLLLKKATEEQKKIFITEAWYQMDQQEKFVFNKLMSASFRVGVSKNNLIKAIALHTGLPESFLAHRLMGNWDPQKISFSELISFNAETEDISKPYPFCLAYALESPLAELGSPEQWQAEWKWDGIRGQLMQRKGNFFLWSRGEELVTDKFPELASIGKMLPAGTVLDGEILPYREGKPLGFQVLQTRIGRKNVSAKILKDAPVAFFAYDLLEWNGEDWRERKLQERRAQLEEVIESCGLKELLIASPVIDFSSWEELTEKRKSSREKISEGLMLKKKDTAYLVGRKKGAWWKWKLDPYTIDAVMIYAQTGSGIRSGLFTDYTFALWDNDKLVPFAKAYSGLTNEEIREVDRFVKQNTLERFGPVRTVKPELVFELAFEGIALSSRHKSGVAVRFPRIHRWRKDKKAAEADNLNTLKKLI
ncbi:MAG: ATP-dependent DNA ligase [Chitinophagaceae bacterium]|nr:ATP-dependent DNA ligase [Chitinophagaceae bacterium]